MESHDNVHCVVTQKIERTLTIPTPQQKRNLQKILQHQEKLGTKQSAPLPLLFLTGSSYNGTTLLGGVGEGKLHFPLLDLAKCHKRPIIAFIIFFILKLKTNKQTKAP